MSDVLSPQWCEKCGAISPVVGRAFKAWSCPACLRGGFTMPSHPIGDFFQNNMEGRRITKWLGYLNIYHRHLGKWRGKEPTVVEIGVKHGGSLDLWKQYFGEGARIIGVDLEKPRRDCSDHEILFGDQADKKFLWRVLERAGEIDILIDDGGHTMKQMDRTFRELYQQLNRPGTYIIEDLHTANWEEYKDLPNDRTIFDLIKESALELTSWHAERGPGWLAKQTHGIHVYESMVVFEKWDMTPPLMIQSGMEVIPKEKFDAMTAPETDVPRETPEVE